MTHSPTGPTMIHHLNKIFVADFFIIIHDTPCRSIRNIETALLSFTEDGRSECPVKCTSCAKSKFDPLFFISYSISDKDFFASCINKSIILEESCEVWIIVIAHVQNGVSRHSFPHLHIRFLDG